MVLRGGILYTEMILLRRRGEDLGDLGWSLADREMALVAGTLIYVEESIYRGYALPDLRARRGTAMAVAVTSVAFGLLHWGNGLEAILFSTVWGVLLAGVFLWRRNLVAPTVAHGLYNLFVLLASS